MGFLDPEIGKVLNLERSPGKALTHLDCKKRLI